ncbi:MAG TPA: hypothetical protein PLM33_03585 [Acidobacteriota bacterium]|nr:hypothetical protein [Acidobacteriota bacterium]
MANEKAVIEIDETPAPVEAGKITLAEAKEGLGSKEAEMAKKHGLVEEKAVEKAEEPKQEVKPDPKPEAKEEKAPDSDLPSEYGKFTPNEKALYWERKKERTKRQRAEAENEILQLRVRTMEKELADAKKTKPDSEKTAGDAKKDEDLDLDDLLKDNEGAKTEAEKPLTLTDLEKHEKEKAEKEETERATTEAKAKQLKSRLAEFEIEAREKLPDFDAVADMAREILEKGEEVFDGDDVRVDAARNRAEAALHAIANAMSWEKGQKTPAELVYDLGRLHPKYKNGARGGAEKVVPPEQMERMLENAGKRSSAALPGGNGSRRVVSEDEITPEQAAKLSVGQYQKLSKATRERLLRM